MSVDELDYNLFYRSLQEKHKKKFEQAQANCWLICIPMSATLRSAEINSELVDSHIYKPSPFFKGQYQTAGGKLTRTIEVEERIVRKLAGFEKLEDIKIVSEESGYNKEFRQFRMLILERPLTKIHKNNEKIVEVNGTSLPQEINLNVSKRFLNSTPEYVKLLEDLDKCVNEFQMNYLVLPDFLDDAACKLKNIIDIFTYELIRAYGNTKEEPSVNATLGHIVQCYVLGQVHEKIFPCIVSHCETEDDLLAKKIWELTPLGLTPDQLGVKESLCCQLPQTIVELAVLDGLQTPYEKLCCLNNVIDLIHKETKENLKESFNPLLPVSDPPCITSDDLLSILVTAIIQAKCTRLASNLFYIEYFYWGSSVGDKQTYSLVTFRAAAEIIKTLNLSQIKPSKKNKMKKELSLVEFMEVTDQVQRKEEAVRREMISLSPADRELERLTRMIEASTRELSQVQFHGIQNDAGCTSDQKRSPRPR